MSIVSDTALTHSSRFWWIPENIALLTDCTKKISFFFLKDIISNPMWIEKCQKISDDMVLWAGPQLLKRIITFYIKLYTFTLLFGLRYVWIYSKNNHCWANKKQYFTTKIQITLHFIYWLIYENLSSLIIFYAFDNI